MIHANLADRIRGITMKAAVLAALAPAMLLGAEARAQSGQSMPPNMGNMPNMPGMQNMPGMSGGSASAATSASATGIVESVNAAQRKIKLNHEPIPAFNWPAMSMEMAAAPSVDLSKVAPGGKVKFTVTKDPDGTYTVQSLSSAQ